MPAIADPGFKLVRDCRAAGIAVTIVPGANAAVTALAGSALPTDKFYFGGFLPPRRAARRKAVAGLSALPGTLIFYEAPQRLADCLADLAALCGDGRPAAVARELTKFFEENRLATLGELAAHYARHPPKGEIVIIVGPAGDSAPVSDVDLDALLQKSLARMSVRDAAAAVSLETGMKKSAVYARAVKLTKK